MCRASLLHGEVAPGVGGRKQNLSAVFDSLWVEVVASALLGDFSKDNN